MPLYAKAAHPSLKVAQTYKPLAFQVALKANQLYTVLSTVLYCYPTIDHIKISYYIPYPLLFPGCLLQGVLGLRSCSVSMGSGLLESIRSGICGVLGLRGLGFRALGFAGVFVLGVAV